MSNPQQAFAAVGGAVIGWFVGGPVGASYGFQIGLLAGTALYPTQLPHVYGPRIEDLNTTTAQLGIPIPYIYGTVAVPGSVIYLGCIDEVATTEELGGKGAPEQEQTTYSYFQTIALGLCEGAIDGVLRIWENGELKYDVRPLQDGETNEAYAARIETSSEYGLGFTLYLGDEEQEADPTLEAELGVGNVPGFRGYAYIVYPDRQLLDDQARRHPIFKFEVYKSVSSGPDVVFSENITGALNDWQTHPFAVDWIRNRYYSFDLTGTDGLRVYSLIDNTELEQVLFSDLFASTGYATARNTFTLDPRTGLLYIEYFPDFASAAIAKVDPDTLEVVSIGGLSIAAGGLHGAVVTQYGAQTTRTFIVYTTLLGNNIHVWNADGMASFMTFSTTSSEDPVPVQGWRDGTTSFALVVGYQLAGSGTTDPIEIHVLSFFEIETLGSFLPIVDRATYYIEPAEIVPTWTRLTLLADIVFDETDDCLIFTCEGAPAAAGIPDPYIVKWDPQTQTIVWAMPAGHAIGIVLANNAHLTRLRHNRLALPTQSGGNFAMYDTRDGTFETIDLSALVPTGLGNGAEYIYDSGYNAAIGRNNDGPQDGWTLVFFDRRTPGQVSLAEIVRDVWERCAGDLADIDVADLETRFVDGYTQTRTMAGRGLIEPLRPLGPFDGVESDGIYKFPTRGKALVATLTESDLGVHTDGSTAPAAIQVKTVQEVELPHRIRVRYIASSRDYEPGEQLSTPRFTANAVNVQDIDLPVVISDDLAAQTAEIIWSESWLARWLYEATVDDEFLALDPADCVGLPVDGRVYRARIISIDDADAGLIRKLALMRDDDGSYVSEAVADSPFRNITSIAIYSPTALILLDIPPLRDEDDDAGVYAAVYPQDTSRQWNGAIIHRSDNGGITYGPAGTILTAATVGTLAEDLAAGVTTVFDVTNEIVVDVLYGEFESRTETDLLENRANGLAIGAHGRWEIVQFTTATQETDTRWRLSGLLRGRRATEHNVGLGVEGDLVVLLAQGVGRLPLQIADINVERVYRPVSIQMQFNTGTDQDFTGEGEALRPFSPVDIQGERDLSNDLTISWVRRGRIGYELPDGADIPLSEETESYEIDVLDDAVSPHTVLRTIEVEDATSTIYTAAQQTIDGLTPGDPVTVRIYQISATVGRGHYGESTL